MIRADTKLEFISLFSGIGGFDLGFERAGGTGHIEPGSAARQRLAATASAGAPDRRNDDIAYTLPASSRGTGDGHGNAWNSNYVTYAEQRSDQYADASVDATLASRDGKGVRTVVALSAGDGADISPTLTNEGHDGSEDGRGRKAFVIIAPLADSGAGTARTGNERTEAKMLVVDLQQVTSAENRSTPTPETPPLTPQSRTVVFTQNEREEVRDLGDKAGAIASEPGAHQQNYVAFNPKASASTQQPVRKNGKSETLAAAHPEGVFGHSGVRRLTPTECERLQSFPDGWTEGQSDSARYKQLGNAVCVKQAEWLGRRIVGVSS